MHNYSLVDLFCCCIVRNQKSFKILKYYILRVHHSLTPKLKNWKGILILQLLQVTNIASTCEREQTRSLDCMKNVGFNSWSACLEDICGNDELEVMKVNEEVHVPISLSIKNISNLDTFSFFFYHSTHAL